MSIDNRKQGKNTDYDVGYGKPPIASRFNKGKSGNPRGRPNGKKNKLPPFGAQEMMPIILGEAYRPIKITENGQQIEIPVLQAVVRSLALRAVRGETSAQKLLTQLVQKTEEEDARLQEEFVQSVTDYKQHCEDVLAERARLGITGPEPPPHPDDISIIAGHVWIRGPVDWEEKVKWDRLRRLKAKVEEGIEELEEVLRVIRDDENSASTKSPLRQCLEQTRQIQAKIQSIEQAWTRCI